MSEKSVKSKQAKPKRASASKASGRKGAEPSVLGSLSSTRPNRLGRRREGAEPVAAAARKPAAARTRSANGAAKPRKPAARREPAAAGSGPTAVSSGSPRLRRPAPPPQGHAVPEPERGPAGPPTGIELVTTAVQAAGEVAQIGFTVGGQILKRAVGRLPRP